MPHKAPRSRSTLALNKIAEFKAYCEAEGWVAEPPKSFYEVLRMRHPDRKDPLIVHKKLDAKEHATTQGESAVMCRRWLSKRPASPSADLLSDIDSFISNQTGVPESAWAVAILKRARSAITGDPAPLPPSTKGPEQQ